MSVQTVRMTRRAAWMRWSSGGAQAVTLPRKNASLCKRAPGRTGGVARTFGRQVVQLHIRLALLNRFSQLGRPQTVVAAAVA